MMKMFLMKHKISKPHPEEEMNDMNKEMSINYSQTNILWDQNEIEDIDEIFPYFVASDIMSGDDDPEPKSVIDCQNRPDWDKWKDAMHAELNSLNKRKVFGPIVTTLIDVKPVGWRWIFVQKRNEKNKVTRYLISLAVFRNLKMRLMDVFTAYLYGSIDNDIYMKIPEGFKILKSLSSKPKEVYSIKLQRSLYGLKQSGRMWHNRLIVYVDDPKIIGTNKEINEFVMHLKEEFEMKDLGKTKYCLGLQIEHMPNGRSLNVDNHPFCPCEEGEDVLGPEVPYLSAIGALIYADAGYLSAHKARSQTGYVFLNEGTAISWRSQKQTLVATSSNHAEVIPLHEASRECVWLRSMTQLIMTSCWLSIEKSPNIIHEDNATCVAQMKEGYIKSDRTKHIPLGYFAYTQKLIKDNQIEMKFVQSSNNSVDLFTKALSTLVFKKHVHAIGMRGYGGDPLVDRQRKFATMLETLGVHLITKFDDEGYHGVEMFDRQKAQVLYDDIKSFIWSLVKKSQVCE
nr:hypothetical protein [Tanacetum cinerariifolium]